MLPQVIIIVGATSMIGRSCFDVLSKSNHQMVLVGKSSEKLNKMVASQTTKTPPKLFCTDLCDEKSVNSIISKTIEEFGRIDAIIYNVSIYPWKKIEDLSYEEWQQTITTNLSGAFLITKSCIPHMKEKRQGKIIYLSSIAGEQMGLPFMSGYSSSKAGLNGLMRTAAIELAPFNINVNCISPGKIYDSSTLSDKEIEDKTKPIPLNRFVKPQDVASMVSYLLSTNASNITGQNFIIDGGQTILGEESHLSTSDLY